MAGQKLKSADRIVQLFICLHCCLILYPSPVKPNPGSSQEQLHFPRPASSPESEPTAKSAEPSGPDLSIWVNPLTGTANGGNVNPGASVPFGVVKLSADCKGYNPAGYNHDPKTAIYGFSPLHDSGVGSSNSYNIFALMPMQCPEGFTKCRPDPENRIDMRVTGLDIASPGYFSMTLNSTKVKMEGTSTRRAGRQRYTFENEEVRYFALDLIRDGPKGFMSGHVNLNPSNGRVQLGGRWASSFAPNRASYEAFACYDFHGGGQHPWQDYGVWTSKSHEIQEEVSIRHLSLSPGSNLENAGAIFSYSSSTRTVEVRFGVSFVSADQACSNMEEEVGYKSFEVIRKSSVDQWNEKLRRLEIPLDEIDTDLGTMIYTNMYRSFLTPHNATGEGPGPFKNTTSPYFDSMYCSWDTFRTFFPWLNLHSPVESAQIAENYIDGWRKTGSIPECRANNVPGYIQGGSSGTNVLADFAVKYHDHATALGVHMEDMYSSLINDGETTPKFWTINGRQNTLYKKFGFIPAGVHDEESFGMSTRESSRTIEYAFNDFAIAQVSRLLGHKQEAENYIHRSLWYRNVWDSNTTSDGFKGFFQKRKSDGSFFEIDPIKCSPRDPESRALCFFEPGSWTGFYEASSWEYSYFAPHDTDHLIKLQGGPETFIKRLDHFFDKGYYDPGNEPAFQTLVGYHYANQPARSVTRIRKEVLKRFGSGPDGIPGNDDNGAMATWLLFHLLGLYPVPSTNEYLVNTPWIPYYTIHNSYLNVSTTVKVVGFDRRSLADPVPEGVPAFIDQLKFNGKPTKSRCSIDFEEIFKLGGELEIILTEDKKKAEGCKGPVPQSISTGAFGFPPITKMTSPSI